MNAITIRLTDELRAYVEDEAESNGYPDVEAYVQALLMDAHGRRTAALHRALEAGEASGCSDRTIDEVFADARERYRSPTG